MLFPPPAAPAKPCRVAVTGAGIVTALGFGWRANADGFRVGRQAFRPVTLFDVSRQRARIAAEVDFSQAGHPLTGRLSQNRMRRLDRATRMLLHAAQEAWAQARWLPDEATPLILGTTGGGMTLGEGYLRHALQHPASQRMQATRVVNYQARQQALQVGDAFGFRGPIVTIANACASGANALGHAWDLLRTGRARRVFAGGYDALCQMIFAGFDSLQALSLVPCQPFAADRSGLSLGEGAAMFALETLEAAQERDATILGEMIGYAAATDIHHLTQPDPRGGAAIQTMTRACQRAGVSPAQVDYLNAHGTATPQNDSAETAAINAWAENVAPTLPVSSTKASIGHLLGAAGAVEALVCLMALKEQWLPPETGVAAIDPACRFQLVRHPARGDISVALSNSFGFGGAHASLIFRRWA